MTAMKKILVLIAVFAAAVSCNKEQEVKTVPASELKALTFHAVSDVTKTSLADNGKNIIWSTSDEINVFSGEGFATNTKFTVTSVERDGSEAVFDGLGVVSSEYYALFPYQSTASITGAGVVTAELPSSQAAVAGSFGPAANIAVAHITGTEDLEFKNVGALLGVTVEDASITHVKVESLGGEYLSGTAQISYNSGAPSVNVTDGKTYVETDVAGAGTYYLVVFPGSYEGGFKVSLTRSGYTASVKNATAANIDRNAKISLINISSVPEDAWNPVFTPGEKVYIKGLSNSDENGQELSYITSTYYDPTPGWSYPGNRGDASGLDGLTYNYEVWARIAEDDEVYFETESGVRFALNVACNSVAPVGPNTVGPRISVSDSPYRIRLNLPTGEAQVARVGIVNYSIIYGNVLENLSYDKAGAWKVDNYVFKYADNQSWDPQLRRYRFSIWFNWAGGQGGSGIDIWQMYGNCSNVNNSNVGPSTEDPADSYYYLQPFTADGWDTIFYLDMNRLFNGGVNGTKKGTINLYMNNTYGHFTHGFSNVVDNN